MSSGKKNGLLSFELLVLFAIFVIGQAVPLEDRSNADEDAVEENFQLYNQFKSLTPQQLAELDEYLSRKLDDESMVTSSSEVLYRNTRRPYQKSIAKRDALWTTTEVLDCVRRLRHFKGGSKLDVVTEMLNCYRRLKHNG